MKQRCLLCNNKIIFISGKSDAQTMIRCSTLVPPFSMEMSFGLLFYALVGLSLMPTTHTYTTPTTYNTQHIQHTTTHNTYNTYTTYNIHGYICITVNVPRWIIDRIC